MQQGATHAGRSHRPGVDARGALLPLVLPVLALQLSAVLPLLLGTHTLWLRDVLGVHLPMREALASALRHGRLPLLDPQRGGGQPLLGNPNGAPLYPTGLLDLLGAPYWSLNAHFWLHFLLAPWAFSWLARRLGCGRGAAWAGGVVYALSGFFLSQLSFYNLVGGATLAPAFVAACLQAASAPDADASSATHRRTPLAAAAAGALWALLLLAGEPTLAALSLALAVLAVLLVPARREGRGVLLVVGALACGTLVAVPQIGELLRALPASSRGALGFDVQHRLQASWDPRQAVEQLIPLAYGRLDRFWPHAFWGWGVHGGELPLFPTLHPGVLALALAAAGALGAPGERTRRARRFALLAVGVGLLVVLGSHDPLLAPLIDLPGARLLRFPLKAWLLVALGTAALAALGWEAAFAPPAEDAARRRHLPRALAALVALLVVGAALCLLLRAPLAAWMARQQQPGVAPQQVADEPLRWMALALLGAALAAAAALLTRATARTSLVPALLLTLHAGSQLALLGPATMPRVAVADLRLVKTIGDLLPAGTSVQVEPVREALSLPHRKTPDGSASWMVRQAAAAGAPLTGVARGWRYDLERSPEGLDGLVTRLSIDALRIVSPEARLHLLRGWGVQVLVAQVPLDPHLAGVRPLARVLGPLAPIHVYTLDAPVPPLRRVAGVRWADGPRAALRALVDPRFDPRREVVLAWVPGDPSPAAPAAAPPPPAGGEAVRAVEDGPERLVVDTGGASAGWLVVERTWQPLWRATVDGAAAPVRIANLQRMAVAVPAGQHRVELFTDRAPLHRELLLAAAGALGLLALALAARRSPGSAAPAATPPP